MTTAQLLTSQPANVSGSASRVSAAEKAAIELRSRPAVLRATIQVTRAATGKVEEYEIIGHADQPEGAK